MVPFFFDVDLPPRPGPIPWGDCLSCETLDEFEKALQRREEQINDEEAEAIVHWAVQRGIDTMRELDL